MGWRHIKQEGDSVRKKKHHTQTEFSKCLEACDLSAVRSVLDWGPGSGWMSEMICENREVYFVDVSKEVLDKAVSNIPHAHSLLINNNDSYRMIIKSLSKTDIDMIVAFSVIYHFPSFEYFEAIAECWKRISPKYICIKTMISRESMWEWPEYEKYAESNNYLRGLLLTEHDLLSKLQNYNIALRETTDTVIPGKLGQVRNKIQLDGVPEYESVIYTLKRKDIT